MILNLRLRGRSTPRLNEVDLDKINATLVRRKRVLLMEHLNSVQPLPRLAEIYRAMNGDKEAQKHITFRDVAGLDNSPTFAEFLRINRLQAYEGVLR